MEVLPPHRWLPGNTAIDAGKCHYWSHCPCSAPVSAAVYAGSLPLPPRPGAATLNDWKMLRTFSLAADLETNFAACLRAKSLGVPQQIKREQTMLLRSKLWYALWHVS
ncbi:hypothetical protein Ahy_A03g011698 isoform B [Arachis hypogaea]|uniref:Uncharacterized protein n=1 Tax=Arachis hypogaea TaxID=3818 RepID=A0A445DRH9_ARAHY|nr:hypothetical protein Ahy_A03g011698 isoform B [Arachis hypogaea]